MADVKKDTVRKSAYRKALRDNANTPEAREKFKELVCRCDPGPSGKGTSLKTFKICVARDLGIPFNAVEDVAEMCTVTVGRNRRKTFNLGMFELIYPTADVANIFDAL